MGCLGGISTRLDVWKCAVKKKRKGLAARTTSASKKWWKGKRAAAERSRVSARVLRSGGGWNRWRCDDIIYMEPRKTDGGEGGHICYGKEVEGFVRRRSSRGSASNLQPFWLCSLAACAIGQAGG